MKIMIIGAHPSGNKGAEAMLEVISKKLNTNIKNVTFLFETLSDSEDFSSFENKKFKFNLIKFIAKKLFSPYSSNLKTVDVVIDIGGLVYTDKSIRDNLRSFVKHVSLIVRKKKLIFFTQDFGPAKKLHTKVLGGFIVRKSFMIFSRSSYSYNVLINDFKVKKSKVKGPFPDSTLLLTDDNKPLLVNETEEYVVLSPSAILYNNYGKKYLDLLSSVIDYVAKKHKVYVLVHTFTKNNLSSDQFVVTQLCKQNKNAIEVSKNVNPIIIKNFLASAKYVISSRYHVIVGAMSTNVPAIALGWNEKYHSFLSLYDMPENNIQFNKQSLELIKKIINKFDAEDATYKERLALQNVILKKEVEASFKLLTISITN